MMKAKWIISIILLISLMLSLTVLAEENEDYIDPNIPESWYEAPQTASEIGITEFNQSPILEKRVEEGELPPVEKRLPEDPPVIEPYDEIGKYGGTVTMWAPNIGSNFNLFLWNYSQPEAALATPEIELVPNLIKGWEYSDNYKKITLHLRKGLKWSNGQTLTADDYMFWWEHYVNNKDLEPTPPEEWKPPLLDVTREGKWAVTFHYGNSVPYRHLDLNGNMGTPNLGPHEFMKQIHPDFVEKEKVIKMAEEVNLAEWYEYYGRIQTDSPSHPEYDLQRPVLTPYICVKREETYTIWERNPYYPFVDPEGNQLPYVDKIRINLANSQEMAATKAATGEADFAAWYLHFSDIPLYKKNEEEGNYKTIIFRDAGGSQPAIHLNQSTQDLDLRKIFQDFRFRKALSLAMDRDNINKKIYYNMATPMQATVNPINDYYKPEYGEAYAEHDPEQARELLDEMGMIDVNDDGFRETPEGDKFNPTIFYSKIDLEPTNLLELVRKDWEEIGIDVELKNVSRELRDTRWPANEENITTCILNGVIGDYIAKKNFGLRYFAPIANPTYSEWPGWVNWYLSDGEKGVEPPAAAKDLIDWAETLMYSPDEDKRIEARDKLIKSQAENLWLIGTVGMRPQPIIVNNRLKNVPQVGPWGWSIRFFRPYHTEQIYIEE